MVGLSLSALRRYQPLLLSVSMLLIVILSLLLEAILPSLITTPTPKSYDEPTVGLFSQQQLQELLRDWKTLEEIQPASKAIRSQVESLENSLNSTN